MQVALELLHAGDAAADEFVGDVGAAQLPPGRFDHAADARLVVAAGRDLLGDALAKDFLHLGIAGETETLGEADHRGGLHAAATGHVLDALQPDMVAVLLDITRDQLELPAQGFEFVDDRLEQALGGRIGGR